MTYQIIAQAFTRRYEITGGLREGYHEYNAVHHVDEVITLHHAWQWREHEIIEIRVQPCEISYGAKYPDERGPHMKTTSEPGFIASGTVNPLYYANRTDIQVLELLFSLADYLAEGLRQQRIYVNYDDMDYICERAKV